MNLNPIYATEWKADLFQCDEPWNINNLSEKHSIINVNAQCDRIPGVQSSFAIVGMEGTWFCAHTEDSDSASLNILKQGAPKIWYSIPHSDASKFEKLFYNLLGKKIQFKCDTVIRHKCFIIPPWVLAQHGIKFTKHVQRPGEIMFTLYGCYHFGLNTGFNVCEAANITSPKFLDFFSNTKLCKPPCW